MDANLGLSWASVHFFHRVGSGRIVAVLLFTVMLGRSNDTINGKVL